MVKLIEDNSNKQVVCSHCKSLIEYNCVEDPFCDDIRYDEKKRVSVYSWYIRCPKCNTRIKVKENN